VDRALEDWAGAWAGRFHSGLDRRGLGEGLAKQKKAARHKSHCCGLKWARGACGLFSLGDSASIYFFSTMK
jgi:hypothetical protein